MILKGKGFKGFGFKGFEMGCYEGMQGGRRREELLRCSSPPNTPFITAIAERETMRTDKNNPGMRRLIFESRRNGNKRDKNQKH